MTHHLLHSFAFFLIFTIKQLSPFILPVLYFTVCVYVCAVFFSFSKNHDFIKPNDDRALGLMNRCATRVMECYNDIVISIGMSDEFSFIFHPHTHLFGRRSSKINSAVTSLFTSNFLYYWNEFFPNTK